ncbi:AAA family ATPase [Rhodococcus aetherivorans]
MGVPIFIARAGVGEGEFARPPKWPELDAAGNLERLKKYERGDALCAVLGGPVVVVDVDVKNDADIAQVRAALDGLGVRVFGELDTPSGGKHFYVAGHLDLPTVHASAGRDGFVGYPGVELLSFGSHVFLPGTARPKYDGKGYTVVLDDLEALADGGDPDGAETLVDWVSVHRVRSKSSEKFTPSTRWDGVPPDVRQQRYLDAVLRREAEKVSRMRPNTGRNQALYQAGLACGNYIAGAGMDENRVLEVLLNAARECGLVGEDGERACRASIRSGIRNGLVRPRAVPDERTPRRDEPVAAPDSRAVEPRGSVVGEVREQGERPRMRDRLLTLPDLRSLPPVEPLIEGLLYRDTLAQLSGAPGSYKSFAAVAMSCAVAAGIPFCDFSVPRSGKVVYVAAEGANGLECRILAWCEANQVDPEMLIANLFILPTPIHLGVWMDVSEAVELVREVGADLLVLDTRARCTVGLEENSATAQGEAIDALDRIRVASGCTVLGVHHSSRAGTAGRGSNAWDGAVWSDLRVEGGGLEATIHCAKHKDVAAGCDHRFGLVRHTVSTERMPGRRESDRQTLVLSRIGPGLETLTANSQRVVLEIIRTSAPDEGFTARDIIELAEPMRVRKSAVYAALKQLVSDGYVRNVGSERRSRFVPTGRQQ